MNNKELLKELEKKMARYGYCDTQTHIGLFIKEYEALTKDEKPIRLKDVIKRIQGFDDETKLKWTYDILKELGSDFGSKMFHEGYQQGRFDEAVETHHEPEKVTIPQFVADWIEECKNDDFHLFGAMEATSLNRKKLDYWFREDDNMELFARAWLDGYTVEEKRYLVRVKGIDGYGRYLNKASSSKRYCFASEIEIYGYITKHTRKELEEADFGWVFDCEGIEIEEVTE